MDVTANLNELSLSISPWIGAMSTGESWGVNGYAARCTIVPYLWSCSVNWRLAES